MEVEEEDGYRVEPEGMETDRGLQDKESGEVICVVRIHLMGIVL